MNCITDAAAPVVGFEGFYAITKNGVVYSLPRKHSPKMTIMKPVDNMKSGYLRVKLSNADGNDLYYIHVLVAKAYIPNPENKPMVNHIDGNKRNNSLENLEWVTGQENHDHAFLNGLYPKQKIGSWQKKEVFDLVQQGVPVKEVAEKYGFRPGGVNSLVRRYKKALEAQALPLAA